MTGFNSSTIATCWAFYISKRRYYHACYKMFHLYLNWNNRQHRHQLIPFVLSVRWVRNTNVFTVTIIHTAKIVSLKCIRLALYSKNINLYIRIRFLAQLEENLAYVKITTKRLCIIVELAHIQFAIAVSVHLTEIIKPSALRK